MIPLFLIILMGGLAVCEIEADIPSHDVLAEGMRRIKQLERQKRGLANQARKLSFLLEESAEEVGAELKRKMHEAGEHLNIYRAYNFASYLTLICGKLEAYERYLEESKNELDRYENILKESADDIKNAALNRRHAEFSN